ncbi:hypothetical protein BD769DRAFT_1485039 [Suillus cothurnatus]|nr:hypothetical protein BD769DRAFT_1485039 [Suillus cothurnatus]
MCLWDVRDGLRCNELIRGQYIPTHFREAHGIHGPDKKRVICLWESCNREFNKESLARHVGEVHLGIVFPCDCGAVFSRKDTLNKHRRACTGLQQ